jgi:hypothetical protein
MAAKKAPWRKLNPKKKKKGGPHKLSPAQKVRAKGSARKAGRPYPNLVDNMLVAKRIMKRPEPTAPASSESSLEKHAAVSMEDCRIHDLRTHCSELKQRRWRIPQIGTPPRAYARAQYEVDPIVVVRENFVACTNAKCRHRPLTFAIEAIPEDICSR